jgi:hypothetical protein
MEKTVLFLVLICLSTLCTLGMGVGYASVCSCILISGDSKCGTMEHGLEAEEILKKYLQFLW